MNKLNDISSRKFVAMIIGITIITVVFMNECGASEFATYCTAVSGIVVAYITGNIVEKKLGG